MNVTLLFTALVGAILVLLLLVRQLRTKSWLEKGIITEDSFSTLAPKRVGLFVFLGVVTSLFLLFMIIYNERAEFPDWRPIADSRLLWFNTALLVIGSAALQLARNAAGHGRLSGIRINLTAAGVFTIAFLVGQIYAWNQLTAAGHFMATNPADAFFYLLTGLHGVHLLGGLFVWAKATTNAWQKPDPEDVSQAAGLHLSVQLCSVYWHYLLLLWLVLFYMFTST
ncbi:MAG: cytochrome-c oxidase [Gammaproteobacteria bacterium]|nr:cytochrome-c oxidase [Gammaproteobacteria bacterium]MDH3507286.1 cytochrome-c oxidase [Gammaproteobacteria bacterium]